LEKNGSIKSDTHIRLQTLQKYLGVLNIVESQEVCSMMKLNSEGGWQCPQPNLCWSWICSGVKLGFCYSIL